MEHLNTCAAFAKTHWMTLLPINLAIASQMVLGGEYDHKWFSSLKRRSFDPPGWVWGTVCPALLVTTGYALDLVWNAAHGDYTKIMPQLAALGLTLLFNSLWSPVFFKRHNIGLALAVSAASALSAGATAHLFRPWSVLASNLMLAFAGWFGFATLLNLFYWVDNPLRGSRQLPVRAGSPRKAKRS